MTGVPNARAIGQRGGLADGKGLQNPFLEEVEGEHGTRESKEDMRVMHVVSFPKELHVL